MVADPSADSGQGVFFLDKLQGFPIFALGSQSYIPLDRNVSGAGGFAGRSAALFDREGAWYGLRVSAECRAATVETLIVFIAAFNGTDFGAFAAPSALGGVHVAGLLQ